MAEWDTGPEGGAKRVRGRRGWVGLGSTLGAVESLCQQRGAKPSFSSYSMSLSFRSLSHYEVPRIGRCIVTTREGPITPTSSNFVKCIFLCGSVIFSFPCLHSVTGR